MLIENTFVLCVMSVLYLQYWVDKMDSEKNEPFFVIARKFNEFSMA